MSDSKELDPRIRVLQCSDNHFKLTKSKWVGDRDTVNDIFCRYPVRQTLIDIDISDIRENDFFSRTFRQVSAFISRARDEEGCSGDESSIKVSSCLVGIRSMHAEAVVGLVVACQELPSAL